MDPFGLVLAIFVVAGTLFYLVWGFLDNVDYDLFDGKDDWD